MGNKMKYLIGFLILVVGIILFSEFSSQEIKERELQSVTESNGDENLEIINEKIKVMKKITNETESEKKDNVVNYNDIFKEPTEMQTTVEKVVEVESLSELDSEVKQLILEADKLIKKENLQIEKQNIDSNEMEQYNSQLEELNNKLNALETE